MKRHRLDTITGAQIIASQIKKITWPDYVYKEDGAQIFFDNIIEERATSLWSNHEVDLVAMLSNAMARSQDIGAKVRKLGEVIKTPSGGLTENPFNRVLRDLSVMIKQYRQTLGLQEAAKGNPADRDKRNEIAKQIEGGLMSSDDRDDLASLFN